MTEEQRIQILEEATKRAEAARPKQYIKVIDKEEDPLLIEAQTVADELVSLIPEEIRETFRIELYNNRLITTERVIKKREQPHTLILPRHRAEANLKGVVTTGILNHYLNQSIIPSGQIQALLDILSGKESHIEITAKPKRNRKGSDKPAKTRTPKLEDKDKLNIQYTPNMKKVKLAYICEQLGIDPKKARAKLRKVYNKPSGGWEWSIDKVDEIKAFLK